MKETFYFSHDYNARNDDKLLELRDKYKNEGYAVYFYCIETMAERGDGYILPTLIGGLSLGYGVAKEWLIEFLDCCVSIKLLNKDEKGYFSQRMIEHLNTRNMFREQGIKGAKIRWKNSPPNRPPNAKERKGKERKVYSKSEDLPHDSLEELKYEPLVGDKTKGNFLDRARAKKGKPPMLKKDPSTWGIINLYRKQYKYIMGKDPYVGDADYFHILSITKKMSPQDMETMIIWYVKAENKKFKEHPSLKSIFTIENLNLYNNQK
jgi:hypothetical protein